MSDYYSFLKKSIRLLVIEDEQYQRAIYQDNFDDHCLFDVQVVATALEAQKCIQSELPYHVCILDLGINDVNNDEFYILKQFASEFPILIVSGASDISRGFKASEFGALHLFKKPVNMGDQAFWDRLSEVFLTRKILPVTNNYSTLSLDVSVRALIEHQPQSVSEWAHRIDMSEGYLRNLWKKSWHVSPKKTLFLYQLYADAFHYFNALFLYESGVKNSELPKVNDEKYKNQLRYYQSNKDALKMLLTNNTINKLN